MDPGEALDLVMTLPAGNLTLSKLAADEGRKRSEERAAKTRRVLRETQWEEV